MFHVKQPGPGPAVAAAGLRTGRLPLLERYAALLASEGVTRGLIGPREVPASVGPTPGQLRSAGPLIPDGATVADLGSGAGLPGVVLAMARPDLTVTLIEPMARRVGFLEEVRAELELSNVEVVRARAEQWPRNGRFDVVTARALAALPKLLAWCLPLVAEHGELLAMKGSSAQDEIVAAAEEPGVGGPRRCGDRIRPGVLGDHGGTGSTGARDGDRLTSGERSPGAKGTRV